MSIEGELADIVSTLERIEDILERIANNLEAKK
jgi:hypothetical protein